MSFLALEKKGEGKLQSISLVTRFYNRIKNKFKKTFFFLIKSKCKMIFKEWKIP